MQVGRGAAGMWSYRFVTALDTATAVNTLMVMAVLWFEHGSGAALLCRLEGRHSGCEALRCAVCCGASSFTFAFTPWAAAAAACEGQQVHGRQAM